MQIPWEKEEVAAPASTGRKLIPVGTYVVKVHSAEVVKNFQGNDSVKVILSIQGGHYHGSWITEYFDVCEGAGKPDQEMVRRARRRLQHLAIAAGIVGRPYTVSELLGCKVQVMTRLKETAKWGLVPRIARFDPLPAVGSAAGSGDSDAGTISVEDMPF